MKDKGEVISEIVLMCAKRVDAQAVSDNIRDVKNQPSYEGEAKAESQ